MERATPPSTRRRKVLDVFNRYLFLVVLFFALPAQAYYVVPYDLRIGEGPAQERFTVIVVLADHYSHFFGEPDGLSRLMAGNYHSDSKSFLSDYLKQPYDWYIEQLKKHPEIYGENANAIAEGLRHFESIADGKSSAVIITGYHRLDQIKAFLRVDTANEAGLLSSEAHFLNRGLGGVRFPQPRPQFKWSRISDFRPESYQEGFHRLGFPLSERRHYWLEGENVEAKNFGIGSGAFRKFFKYLYFIAYAHKMFSWGAQTVPEEIRQWPDGTPMPADAHTRFGRRVSHVWLDAYSDVMRRFYESFGFRVWKKINNKDTQNRDLYFMVAPVRKLESKVKKLVQELSSKERLWLVHDDELSARMHAARCIAPLIDLSSN